jgi:hypothetical protein
LFTIPITLSSALASTVLLDVRLYEQATGVIFISATELSVSFSQLTEKSKASSFL